MASWPKQLGWSAGAQVRTPALRSVDGVRPRSHLHCTSNYNLGPPTLQLWCILVRPRVVAPLQVQTTALTMIGPGCCPITSSDTSRTQITPPLDHDYTCIGSGCYSHYTPIRPGCRFITSLDHHHTWIRSVCYLDYGSRPLLHLH